jgi:hypothetical protein
MASVAIVIALLAGVMVGCQKEEFESDFTLPKSDYENILKKKVGDLMAQNGLLEESFLFIHGLPVWEESRWVNVNSKDMLVVPLLSSGLNKKYVIGTVDGRDISAVITELSGTDISKNRILALNNATLYDNGAIVSRIRLKSGNEADDLLQNGGSAQDLFAAANSGGTYDSNANAGTLTLKASTSGNSSSTSMNGHAWIEYTDNSGNTTTFSTWGNRGSVEYLINEEKKYTYSDVSSYSVSISYKQFQNILNYNATNGNTNWSPTYNCAGYASGVWDAVTGTSINGGILMTPSDVANWINNQ